MHKQNEKAKHLLRLALAEQSLLEADSMAEHLLATKINPESDLYHCAVSGLVATYCRPFLSANGLGPVSQEFGIFSDAPNAMLFSQLHNDMLTARNKLSAHFDFEFGEGQFRKGNYALHPGEVQLTLEPERFGIRTNHTTLSPEMIRQSRFLIGYQLKRIKEAQAKFVISLVKNDGFRIGTYVFSPTALKS